MGIDAFALHFRLLEISGRVVADFPDVARRQSPAAAGDHGAGHLSSGTHLGGEQFDFGIRRGEAGQAQDRVGGVDSDADDIGPRERNRFGHEATTVAEPADF